MCAAARRRGNGVELVTIPLHALETWAGILLDHSLGGITPDDRVMIKGERVCWPLLEVLERRVIEAGAVPDLYLIPPNNERGRVWSAAMGRWGSPEQLAKIPDWHRARYESMTKYVEVLGAEDPTAYMGLEAGRLQALAAADRPFADLRLSKPWVITLFPTAAFAALEGLEPDELTEFIVRASTTDPQELRAAEERLAPLFERGSRLEIVTEHPAERRELRLTMDLSLSRPVLSFGLRNFPDGEIFTSPDARSVEGELYLDLPVNYGGEDMSGIYLRFEAGQIVEHAAAVGGDRLAAIVETDAGSRRLGEVALGMNPGLDRVLKHPLFVEKVGGTLHVAIGASYDEGFVADPASEQGRGRVEELEASGALNRSAQHVDLVIDFRPGGCGRRVTLDGTELAPCDGVWTAR